jgi:GDP-mannose 6-dehydrogenase
MQYRAQELDVDMPVIRAILPSNQRQIQQAIDQVLDTGKRRIGLLGFSFKAGTDDLRESPIVILAEALLGKGLELRIYDRNVATARLVGANKEYINQQIPHLSALLCHTLDEVLLQSEVIVVGNAAAEFGDALRRTRPEQHVIDLVRTPVVRKDIEASYEGICW